MFLVLSFFCVFYCGCQPLAHFSNAYAPLRVIRKVSASGKWDNRYSCSESFPVSYMQLELEGAKGEWATEVAGCYIEFAVFLFNLLHQFVY